MLILSRPWTRQPQVEPAINWSNPINQSLKAVILGNRFGRAAYGPAFASTGVDSPTIVGARNGRGFETTTAQQVNLGASLFAGLFTGTLIIRVLWKSFAANRITVYEAYAGRNAFQLSPPVNSSSVFTYTIHDNTIRTSSRAAFETNTWYDIAITWGGSSSVTYINGQLDYEWNSVILTDVSTPAANTVLSGYLFQNNATGQYTDQIVEYVSLRTKKLSAAEVAQEYDNPYATLFEPRRISISIPGPASPAMPILSSATYSNITATGFQPRVDAN